MSLTVSDWAWAQALPPSEKLLLLALADCCHARTQSTVCWPSMARLETMTGASRSTLKRTLASLERRGLIQRAPGHGRRSSRYRLACATRPETEAPLRDGAAGDSDSGGGMADPQTVQDDLSPGADTQAKRGHADRSAGGRPSPGRVQGDLSEGVRMRPQRVQAEPRNRKRTGRERETESRAPRSLTQQPPVAWLAIAEQVRPGLRDPRQVFDKFAAHQGEAAYAPAEWERRWRLWLSRERQPPARAAAAERAGRAWGSFLPPPTDSLPAGDDLTADFEVIRHDQQRGR